MTGKNNCLAENNKSSTRGKATNRLSTRGQLDSEVHKTMTLQEAKSIARHLGLTLRRTRSGHYRVSFREGDETTAYYTGNLDDAVNTGVEMARKQALSIASGGVGS
jgi:hypothetical protein